MNGKIREIRDLSIEIPKDSLLSRIGFEAAGEPSRRVRQAIRDAERTVRELARPRAVYRTYPVHAEGRFVFLDGAARMESQQLAKVLNSCDRAAVFVITLGSEMDETIRSSLERRLHQGHILDTAASVAVESAAEKLQDRIGERIPEGFGTTLGYSPGYCDWPLAEQTKLFHLLPDEPVGVNLSRDCLMLPRKSISGIIGIGSSESVAECGNACADCPRTDCPHRRE